MRDKTWITDIEELTRRGDEGMNGREGGYCILLSFFSRHCVIAGYLHTGNDVRVNEDRFEANG